MYGALELQPLADLLKVLGDQTRLRILALLAHGELCVCHVQAALGMPQAAISRQLGILRAAGLLQQRRDGRWIHYSLLYQKDKTVRRVLGAIVADFTGRDEVKQEVALLKKELGPTACK